MDFSRSGNRAWLYFNHAGGHAQKTLRLEWHLWGNAKHTGLTVDRNCKFNCEMLLFVGCYGLFFLFIGLEHPAFRRWQTNRTTGIRIFSGCIWIDVWSDPDEYQSSYPWWKKTITIDPAGLILGHRKYSTRDISVHDATVWMPEGDYPATVRMFEATWKRPRWPHASRRIRAEVEMKTPIPVPGKGENAWDLDDDAIYSIITPADTVTQAVVAIRQSALASRKKYGGDDWQPGDK